MGGLYIHIPFCKSKCLYCDFYSGGVRIADWKMLADCLIEELRQRKAEIPVSLSTIYFGGGTPSLMPEDTFDYLTDHIFDITGTGEVQEFTLEANPEDITDDKCRTWKKKGVNRVSLGIQTLNDRELSTIGRRHNAEIALKAIKSVSDYFGNLSLDVMFGIPGQTLESYEETLDKLLGMNPQHISSYSLMLEDGTALTRLYKEGKLNLPDEEEGTQMFTLTYKKLREAGYGHYEISNYARPGYESKHNSAYWDGSPYLGIGPGAHSYDGQLVRKSNPGDLKGYLQFFSKDGSNKKKAKDKFFYNEERLSEVELREEMIMTRLRTSEGIDLGLFKSKFGKDANDEIMQKAQRFLNGGEMGMKNGFLSLTEKGIEISDLIISSLF